MAATSNPHRLIQRFERMLAEDDVVFMSQEQWEFILAHFAEKNLDDRSSITMRFALDYAIAQHPYCAEFNLEKAQYLHDLGDAYGTIAATERAEQLGMRALDIYLLRADAYTDLKAYADALETLHHALTFEAKDKHLAAIYFHIANIYEEQKRYDKVFDTLRLAAQHDPNTVESLDRLGAVVRRLGNYAQSIVAHQQILDAQPYSAAAWYNLGTAYAALQQHENAIEAYEYALTIQESYALAAIGLAQVWAEIGLYERAEQTLADAEAAAESDVIDADIYYWRAYIYYRMERPADAVRFCTKALQRDATHHAAHFLLGELATERNAWRESLTHYKNATAYANAYGEYWLALAHALMHNEQPEAAIDAFLYAIKTDAKQLDYWLGLINAYLFVEDWAQAAFAIDEATSFLDAPQLGFYQTFFSVSKAVFVYNQPKIHGFVADLLLYFGKQNRRFLLQIRICQTQ